MDVTSEHRPERRKYDRRASTPDALLIQVLREELERARQRITELEAVIAASGYRAAS